MAETPDPDRTARERRARELAENAAWLDAVAGPAGRRAEEQLRRELRVARRVVRTTRESLPDLMGRPLPYDRRRVDDVLSQLSGLAWPAPADGDQVAAAIAGIREALPLIRDGETSDVEQAVAALGCFETLLDSMLDEPYSERLRQQAARIRPVVVRIALSVAVGLLATAAASPLAGEPVLMSLLTSAVGLLVTAVSTELLIELPTIRGVPEPSAQVAGRQRAMHHRIGELNALLDRAYDPAAPAAERERWHGVVQRSALAIQIMTVDVGNQLRSFAWPDAVEYEPLLNDVRELLSTVRADTSTRQVADDTRLRLRAVGAELAAHHIDTDLEPLEVAAPRPPHRRPPAPPPPPAPVPDIELEFDW